MARPQLDRRNFFSTLATGGGTFVLTGRSAVAAADLTLADIVERNTAARGGRERFERRHSKEVKLQIVEQGKVINARYLCDKSPAYRIDIYADGKHVFCEGLDAKGSWIWPGDQVAPRQGVEDGRRAGLAGVQSNLYGLYAYPGLGNALSLDGREDIEGVNYYVVRVEPKVGEPTFLYIDPETWMISRKRQVRAFHPDYNDTKHQVESQLTDFRDVSGLRESFLQHDVDLNTGAITQVTIVQSIIDNPSFDPAELTRNFKPKV